MLKSGPVRVNRSDRDVERFPELLNPVLSETSPPPHPALRRDFSSLKRD